MTSLLSQNVISSISLQNTQVPPTVIYVPNFISESEEKEVLKNVYTAPIPKWTQLNNRRLQNYGGVPHMKGMIPEKIPMWLQKYVGKVNELSIFGNFLANHVLVNEYCAGQGIMPHTDGPLFYPTIATISCGSHTIINFSKCSTEKEEIRQTLFSLLLEPRSLLILQDDLYKNYMHGIDECEEDTIDDRIKNLNNCSLDYNTHGRCVPRKVRISLTIRYVPKTLKFKLFA